MLTACKGSTGQHDDGSMSTSKRRRTSTDTPPKPDGENPHPASSGLPPFAHLLSPSIPPLRQDVSLAPPYAPTPDQYDSFVPPPPPLTRPLSAARGPINPPGDKGGDNIDDLLSWLFNASPETLFTNQQAPAIPVTASGNGIDFDLPHEAQLPTPTRSPRYPEAVHPYAVPNTTQILPQATYPLGWGSNHGSVPPSKEIIDEESCRAMIELFQGEERRELMSPAFGINPDAKLPGALLSV